MILLFDLIFDIEITFNIYTILRRGQIFLKGCGECSNKNATYSHSLANYKAPFER